MVHAGCPSYQKVHDRGLQPVPRYLNRLNGRDSGSALPADAGDESKGEAQPGPEGEGGPRRHEDADAITVKLAREDEADGAVAGADSPSKRRARQPFGQGSPTPGRPPPGPSSAGVRLGRRSPPDSASGDLQRLRRGQGHAALRDRNLLRLEAADAALADNDHSRAVMEHTPPSQRMTTSRAATEFAPARPDCHHVRYGLAGPGPAGPGPHVGVGRFAAWPAPGRWPLARPEVGGPPRRSSAPPSGPAP